MTAGGLEALIAKQAAAAASRAITPLWRRSAQARSVRQAAALVDSSEVAAPDLTPEQAACVAGYVESRDFRVVAVQLALSALQARLGQKATVADIVITQQLTEGLRARGEWPAGTLRQMTDVLRQDLGRYVTGTMNHLRQDGITPLGAAGLAAFAEHAGDQAAAATRNSSVLRRLASLEAIHRFEGDLRAQIRALSQNMPVPNAGGLGLVAYRALYVEPLLDLIPEEVVPGLSHAGQCQTVSRAGLLDVSDRAVILGDPGTGKSTLAAKTVHDLVNDPAGPVPLLLVLRDYIEEFRAGKATIAAHLAGLCRSPHQVEPPPDALEYLLLNGRAMVIFDGLDEVFEPRLRQRVVEAIHGFAHRYPNTPVLVTSRKVGYDEAPLDAALFPAAELRAFSPAQVAEYARKWFALDQPSLADKFLAESELVADLRTNPLMLSLMCSLYRAEGYIPANRPDVYEKCALLLFERWDKQRGIVVPLPFDAHIRQAIQSLAWWLYTEPGHEARLTRARLQEFMTGFLHRERFANRADAENAATTFIGFCTGRAWVLSKTGVSGNQEVFGFTHRTFLEYFAATHLVRRYPDAARLFEQLEPHLRQADWEVVGQLSLQTLNRAVENGANDFLEALISAADRAGPPERSNLLAFAARSLMFVVPKPAVLRRVVAAIVSFFADMPDAGGRPQVRYLVPGTELHVYDQAFVALRQCTGELASDIGQAVLTVLTAALGHEPVPDNVLLVCEEPSLFLGPLAESPAMRKELDELLARYQARLKDHSFLWHDIRRTLDGGLPVGQLVGRYGVRALYTSVHLVQRTSTVEGLASICSRVRTRAIGRADAFAAEIVACLRSQQGPWINGEVARAAEGYSNGHDQGDAANRGLFFAAVLLLELPLIEYGTGPERDRLTGDSVLGDVTQVCRSARAFMVSDQRIRDALVPRAVPAVVTDFVVRWASREFSLVAE